MYIQDDIYKDNEGKWRYIRAIAAGDSFHVSVETFEKFIRDQAKYAGYTSEDKKTD